MPEESRPDDRWSAWLREGRFAGHDQAGRAAVNERLATIRDAVLANAQLRAGEHVIDLGAGTGLLTTAAAYAVAPGGVVTAVDISAAALADIPESDGVVLRRVVADAVALPLDDASADVVLTRSVLIYIADLPRVFAEIARVLRPGGRVSVFEPINARRRHDARLDGLTPAELAAIGDLRRGGSPDGAAMLAFTEHTATAAAHAAGLRIDLLDIETSTTRLTTAEAVEATLNRSPHAGAPTPLEAIAAGLGPDVAGRYRHAWLRALARAPITYTTPGLYLTAAKPTTPQPPRAEVLT